MRPRPALYTWTFGMWVGGGGGGRYQASLTLFIILPLFPPNLFSAAFTIWFGEDVEPSSGWRYMEPTLQRQNTKFSKQIFPEKEYRGLSPNFHIHASVSDLYIPTIGLPIVLEEICRPILGLINRSQTHECGKWG